MSHILTLQAIKSATSELCIKFKDFLKQFMTVSVFRAFINVYKLIHTGYSAALLYYFRTIFLSLFGHLLSL